MSEQYMKIKQFRLIEEEQVFVGKSEIEQKDIPAGSVIVQIEDKDVFRFIYEGEEYWQYYYSIEDNIEKV